MNKTLTRLLLPLVVSALSGLPSAYAQDESARYVADTLYIPLRAQANNQSEIILNGVVSGTLLTFIREETDSNRISWTLVKTAEGKTGWARSQHLLKEPIAKVQLEQLTERYELLNKEYEQLKRTSSISIDMEAENQRLHESSQILQTRADTLQAENDFLRKNDNYNQWMIGGGLLTLGVLLSLILQAIGKRRRRSEWS